MQRWAVPLEVAAQPSRAAAIGERAETGAPAGRRGVGRRAALLAALLLVGTAVVSVEAHRLPLLAGRPCDIVSSRVSAERSLAILETELAILLLLDADLDGTEDPDP